ncbi:MAG TPA: acyl-ACP--UDP-N-acetylglucosamine O-acyltransferase [Bacteroidaceae bacterium]|nr:acyl-ACP--UDP-N-acetylglucosamine O-acyltransferase [Bacteroidaceae bacterium]
MISPLAYVDPKAEIGKNVKIAPFCFIDKNVIIGDNNIIMPHVNLLSGTRMGNRNQIFPGAVIGAIPQDLKYKGEDTFVQIGDNNIIRENTTINRGTFSKGKTEIGDNNLLMEGMHIAHDCVVGNYCIVGNSTKFGGEVVVDDHATISAGVLIHQFCHIGGYVMIQGGSGCSKDVPPFIMAGRNPLIYMGINVVRLRRLNYSNEQIDTIHNAYRIIYQSGMNTSKAIESLKKESISSMPEVQYIIDFIEQAQRGIIRD